jgi:hypothetical protein
LDGRTGNGDVYMTEFKGRCRRCKRIFIGKFPIKLLLAVLCESCNKEWTRYFSERFEREHGTLLGFHTPIEEWEKEVWFKDFLNSKEKVLFT